MGTLFHSFSSTLQLNHFYPRHCCLRSRNNTSILCQGSGHAIKSGGLPSVLTGRSKQLVIADQSQALMEAGSLVLSPNGRAEVAAKELLPFRGGPSAPPADGIGIVKFLRGKCLFITGATGFLAKVLIEKILRTVPDVGKMYLLIKAKNTAVAMERLENEIINADLFMCLQQTHGESYKAFMFSKLVPVAGNVCDADLGLEEESAASVARDVDVILNSAANTTFDERYDVAVEINTRGSCHLMSFARSCMQLKVFLQVSTAYVNGQRQGRIMEKAFRKGDSIAGEQTQKALPRLDVDGEIQLAFESRIAREAPKMKELGLERAKMFGWQDTYVFTKAMGEMLIDSGRGEVPVVIIRPSVIESTFREPFPGWMEGNRMMDPIVLYYGKGQLTGFLADPNGVLDIVPADMVVNATLAAIARHGMVRKPGINIYQITSSTANPLAIEELAKLFYEHFNAKPHTDSNGQAIHVPSMRVFKSKDEFCSHLWQDAIQRSSMASLNGKMSHKLENMCKKSVEQAKHLANIYEPYTFYAGRFDNSNTQRLMEMMSEEERRKFGFRVEDINWKDYISNVHIPGLRRHVMKGRGLC